MHENCFNAQISPQILDRPSLIKKTVLLNNSRYKKNELVFVFVPLCILNLCILVLYWPLCVFLTMYTVRIEYTSITYCMYECMCRMYSVYKCMYVSVYGYAYDMYIYFLFFPRCYFSEGNTNIACYIIQVYIYYCYCQGC